ncbi:MAG: phosphatidylserine decarboxylase [Pirellulaceae bacterium]
MTVEPIVYFDRYRKSLETEKVYGDAFLRWAYATAPGRLTLHTIVKRLWFSQWYGWRMNRASSRAKIAPFIEAFDVDASEFAQPWDQFESFNDFFSRRLTSAARPIDSDPSSAVFPADGRHLCVPNLSKCDGLIVKGEVLDLPTLLRDAELAKRYAQGSLLISRLCPVDYHRFHFPVGGVAGTSRLLNGPLLSVNPIALRQNIQILATNRRRLTVLESDRFGKVLLLEIGATCVGGICQTYQAGARVEKGSEKGYFYFGGSSTITIFEPNCIQFDDDLIENSLQQRELYARMGDHMGRLIAGR